MPTGTGNPCTSVNLIWSDTFNSGTALSADYTINGTINKVAGIGPDASQAIRSNSQLGGEWVKTGLNTGNGRHFCVSIDSKPTYATNFGIFVLELRVSAASMLSLYIGGGDFSSATRVTIYDRSLTAWMSATGVINSAAWQTIKVRGEMSSDIGIEDGWATVFVDGVSVLTVTNGDFSNMTGNTWNQVAGYPQGDGDNLCIANTCDTGAPDPTPGELTGPVSEPCCGGGGASATGPILPPTVSSWDEACDGGGTVPTASDLTDAENWDD